MQIEMAMSNNLQDLRHLIKAWIEDADLYRNKVISVDDSTRQYTYGVEVRLGIDPEYTFNDVRTWVEQTYGYKPYGEYYGERWHLSNQTFWFKYERDRTIFLLRWAS